MAFFMLVGISGSGKSTFAEKIKHWGELEKEDVEIFSSDEIRKELYGDASIQKDHEKVFRILHERVKEALSQGKTAVYDACNLSAKRRKAFLQEIQKYKTPKSCIVIASDYDSCVENQKKRDRKVPVEVIKKQIKSFEFPDWKLEGWDFVYYISPFHNFSLEEELETLRGISHDNPHHSLTIGEHMLLAEKLAKEDGAPKVVVSACRYHDIGKGFCKEFKNYKGEPSEIAHYYGHQNVSAYMILSSKEYANNHLVGKLIASLVQHHMNPYILSEKAYSNKYKNISPMLAAYIPKIHQYDREAH